MSSRGGDGDGGDVDEPRKAPKSALLSSSAPPLRLTNRHGCPYGDAAPLRASSGVAFPFLPVSLTPEPPSWSW
jgi:hypothetical protein